MYLYTFIVTYLLFKHVFYYIILDVLIWLCLRKKHYIRHIYLVYRNILEIQCIKNLKIFYKNCFLKISIRTKKL